MSANAAPGDRDAYVLALKCFVVNTLSAEERKEAGDAIKANSYSAFAKKAFDTGISLGRRLGYSNAVMNSDLDQMESEEMPRLSRDLGYLRQVAAQCKAIGLLG